MQAIEEHGKRLIKSSEFGEDSLPPFNQKQIFL